MSWLSFSQHPTVHSIPDNTKHHLLDTKHHNLSALSVITPNSTCLRSTDRKLAPLATASWVRLHGAIVKSKPQLTIPGFTWRPDPVPEEQAFEAMRTALKNGMNFWNGGELYGTPECNSLTLLEKYFAKYPEDADKVVISIKGAVGPKGPDGSREGIRRSIDNILRLLNGRKKLDIFECARRDPKVPMEETFRTMQEYIDRGLLGGISLSEVAASTIHEAVKYAKIVAVEVELSIFSPDVLTNGVAAACAQYGIPLIAYAPIGRGVSTPPSPTHPTFQAG
jgi:aryl-alcohol dehydrogenase-like predicted oxidoreductase